MTAIHDQFNSISNLVVLYLFYAVPLSVVLVLDPLEQQTLAYDDADHWSIQWTGNRMGRSNCRDYGRRGRSGESDRRNVECDASDSRRD